MRHCPFCDKKCVNFGIKLDAEISIWMQSGFDGFDFSATLAPPDDFLSKIANLSHFFQILGKMVKLKVTFLKHILEGSN